MPVLGVPTCSRTRVGLTAPPPSRRSCRSPRVLVAAAPAGPRRGPRLRWWRPIASRRGSREARSPCTGYPAARQLLASRSARRAHPRLRGAPAPPGAGRARRPSSGSTTRSSRCWCRSASTRTRSTPLTPGDQLRRRRQPTVGSGRGACARRRPSHAAAGTALRRRGGRGPRPTSRGPACRRPRPGRAAAAARRGGPTGRPTTGHGRGDPVAGPATSTRRRACRAGRRRAAPRPGSGDRRRRPARARASRVCSAEQRVADQVEAAPPGHARAAAALGHRRARSASRVRSASTPTAIRTSSSSWQVGRVDRRGPEPRAVVDADELEVGLAAAGGARREHPVDQVAVGGVVAAAEQR